MPFVCNKNKEERQFLQNICQDIDRQAVYIIRVCFLFLFGCFFFVCLCFPPIFLSPIVAVYLVYKNI